MLIWQKWIRKFDELVLVTRLEFSRSLSLASSFTIYKKNDVLRDSEEKTNPL